MSLDLDLLKDEILHDLEAGEFAVFRGQTGSLENMPMVFWDTDAYPDYHGFLNVAKSASAGVIVFSHREFEREELDDLREELADSTLSREERRSVEAGLRDLNKCVGATCSVELSFSHQGHMYVFQLVAEWYDTFLTLSDLLETSQPDDEEEGDDSPPLGGYFSKN